MRRSFAVLIAAVVLFLALYPLSACADAPEVREMKLSKDSVSLLVGDTFDLKVSIYPFNADKNVTWFSSDPGVVSVEDGHLTALSVGSSVVTVTSVQNPSIFLTARVNVVKPVGSITLSDESISMPVGETWEEIAYVLPEDATMQRPVWTSSDIKVATVDEQGVITAVANGHCTVTATAADGFGAKAAVRVEVRKFEAVITGPGEFAVDFEMIEDSGTEEVIKGKKTYKDTWKKTVTFENGKLEKASDTSVLPVAAGAEIVVLQETHSKTFKDKNRTYRHFIFIRKSAVREAGSVPEIDTDGEILFRDIPWGIRYKEVKTLLSSRKEKLKSPIVRNGMLWTQISGEITFGDFKAFRNGLSFTSTSANVQNLTANLQKTSFCMGDYYFDRSIPFENLKQNVMKTYDLPENGTTSSQEECVWVSGYVTVRLTATPKYTQLQIAYQPPAEEEKEETESGDGAGSEAVPETVSGTLSGGEGLSGDGTGESD